MSLSMQALRTMAAMEAEKVRQSYADQEYPVPVAQIARQEGAVVKSAATIVEGSLTKTPKGYIIVVNQHSISRRQRFTIAHELGHIAFERLSGNSLRKRYRLAPNQITLREEEQFCDWFANHLLVPESAIQDFKHWSDVSLTKIIERARSLDVSLTVLIRRLLEELQYSGGFLWFREMGKPSAPQDVRWRIQYGIFPKDNQIFVPRYVSLPPDSILRVPNTDTEYLCHNVKLGFCKVNGVYSVLVMRTERAIIGLVLPPEIDSLATFHPGQIILEHLC